MRSRYASGAAVMALVMTLIMALCYASGAALAAPAGDKVPAGRPPAERVGLLLGAALNCSDVSRARIWAVKGRITDIIKASATSAQDLAAALQGFEQSVSEGLKAGAAGQADCVSVGRDLAGIETSTATMTGASGVPSPSVMPIPPVTDAPASPAPASLGAAPTAVAAAGTSGPIRGLTDREIRFGMSGPLSGPSRELGRQMKMGIETAFNVANEAGGVHGRQLRLVALDDGYEPARTAETMKQLYDKEQVFGVIGNVGTPTAAVSAPFALERRMLFFGAFTGASLLRRDPPDRYVFNFRASYGEETEAAVRHLVKVRRLKPEQIVVFAQEDAYGDAGFAGVEKAMRNLRKGDAAPVTRLRYKRNTVEVDGAVAQLRKLPPGGVKAVVMVATYRAAAKFIEKIRDAIPGLIYTNVSFVGSTALADELMLLGPKFAEGVIVTQVVPAVDGYSTIILEYKSALARYFPGEAADYVSLEGYVTANVLIEGLRRAGPQIDTERLVDVLEGMRDFDMGLGTAVTFGKTEHQGSHKVWGSRLDATGRYQALELQ